MSIGTHAPQAPRLPRRTPAKWPASGDVAALIGILVFIAGVVTLAMVPGIPALLQIGVAVLLVVFAVGMPLLHRIQLGGDASIYLLLPTIMSATQNIYLLPAARAIGKGELQVFIVLNFLIALLTAVALWMFGPEVHAARRLREARFTAVLLVALTFWGFATVVLFHSTPTAAFASYRNFVTPFLFLLLGLLASRTSLARVYANHLVSLGICVIAFAFLERFTPFWTWVPLDVLWRKKNLPVVPNTHYPPNFFSSETLGGEQLRRMVGSFADPVQLGTFLFVVFVAAWYVGRRVTTVLSVVAAVLAISKGALLGFLTFAYFRTRFLQSSTAAFLAATGALGMGIAFYLYTEVHSTGSTSVHIEGLTSALTALPSHPLGHGMGATGILAGLFTKEQSSVSAESGVGVIVGQLGVPGIAIFAALFVMLTRACLRLQSPRERVVAMSLLIGFGLNAAFNEVALSPNSAAPYFVLLGLLIGREAHARHQAGPRVQLRTRRRPGDS
jgi:hypothetical protein